MEHFIDNGSLELNQELFSNGLSGPSVCGFGSISLSVSRSVSRNGSSAGKTVSNDFVSSSRSPVAARPPEFSKRVTDVAALSKTFASVFSVAAAPSSSISLGVGRSLRVFKSNTSRKCSQIWWHEYTKFA